jgi:hypothetical protein
VGPGEQTDDYRCKQISSICYYVVSWRSLLVKRAADVTIGVGFAEQVQFGNGGTPARPTCIARLPRIIFLHAPTLAAFPSSSPRALARK